jgi:NAD-dependent deacetylase
LLSHPRWAASALIAVLTGAGISAESGIPTFRDSGGLWKNFRAEEHEIPFVWEWYDGGVFEAGAECRPPGTRNLRGAPDFTLITQNVDGLHDRAGSARLLKVHGDI